MEQRRLKKVFLFTFPVTLLIFCVCHPVLEAATLRVPTAEYPTIQSAINAAHHLDTVVVADGTWKGEGYKNIDFSGKAITVKSENGPENCIIDCDGAGYGFIFESYEGTASGLLGFTIKNAQIGIRFRHCSPTIKNCTITGCTSAGIYVDYDAFPIMNSCTITNNTGINGAGISFYYYQTGGTFSNCSFTYNTADSHGGAIYIPDHYNSSNPSFIDCTISGNFAGGNGGGIYCPTSLATFSGCTISSNRANGQNSSGGGIYLTGSSKVVNCTIFDNTASEFGGGICGEIDWYSNGYIINCTISKNSAGTGGGGIYITGAPKIWNSIIWENTPNEIGLGSGGAPEIHYSDVQGGYSGTGNLDSDPLFVGGGDYGLSSSSPCINSGNNNAPYLPSEDKKNNWRILDLTTDMGAYEYGGNLTPPSVTTVSANSITSKKATLKGLINPNGFACKYYFEYGPTVGYGLSTPLKDAGSSSVSNPVENVRERLSPNTNYYYRLVSTNGFQTTYGTNQSFTTFPLPPTVFTGTVTSINSSIPTFNAIINPNGLTTYFYFEYGSTNSYGSHTSQRNVGSGTDNCNVIENMLDLSPNTTYHYRIVATNSFGKSVGLDNSFTTGNFGDTLSVPNQYSTIQSAIDAASHLDTVVVADGTWKGEGYKNIDLKGKAITVKSQNGPTKCIIDCDGSGSGFSIDSYEGLTSEISGFSIINASNSAINLDRSSPTISNCDIKENVLGIYVDYNSFPSVKNCTIDNNTGYNGAGISFYYYQTGGTFSNCSFTYNTADSHGGAIYIPDHYNSSNPSFIDCTISGNFADGNGGGIYCPTSLATFSGCTISSNRANGHGSSGGGIYLPGASKFVNCTIFDNTASKFGGGICGEIDWYSNGYIINCTISKNSAGTGGGGIYITGAPKIWNSIIWENTPNEIGLGSGGAPEIHYSDVQGGYSGTGNVDSDPLFVGNNDYHLTANPTLSPCINSAVNYAPDFPSEDKDGNNRTIDGLPDMGAYEYEKLSPTVSTGGVSSVSGTSVTLQGSLNPRGAQAQWFFQYGTSSNYGSTSAQTNGGAGKSAFSVSCPLSGLSPSTTYHYRMAARNMNFTVYGTDRTFSTDYNSVAYVNPDDETCDGNGPCYTDIQVAIDAVASGSQVKVVGDTYTERFTLRQNKSVVIEGGWDETFRQKIPRSTIIKSPGKGLGTLTLKEVVIRPLE